MKCGRDCPARRRAKRARRAAARPTIDLACRVCGDPFVEPRDVGRPSATCSTICRNRLRRAKRRLPRLRRLRDELVAAGWPVDWHDSEIGRLERLIARPDKAAGSDAGPVAHPPGAPGADGGGRVEDRPASAVGRDWPGLPKGLLVIR